MVEHQFIKVVLPIREVVLVHLILLLELIQIYLKVLRTGGIEEGM